MTLRSLSCASLVALQCHTFARKGRVGCRPPGAACGRQGSTRAAHHGCGRAGACGRLFAETFFGGSACPFGGVSRNPRPLAPARPHRAGRLHVVPVTHAPSGDGGGRGNGKGRSGAEIAVSQRRSYPQLAVGNPAIPACPRVRSGTYKPWSGSCPTSLPPPWLRERGVPSCQTVQGQFVRCGHR